MTVDPTDLPLSNSVKKTYTFEGYTFLIFPVPLSGFPQGRQPNAQCPCLFYLRAYTYTVRTAFPNKVFLRKINYVLSFICLNRLRYLNFRRTPEEWLLISETGFKKYCIDDITVSSYHPLQDNPHHKLHTAVHTLPALAASPALLYVTLHLSLRIKRFTGRFHKFHNDSDFSGHPVIFFKHDLGKLNGCIKSLLLDTTWT